MRGDRPRETTANNPLIEYYRCPAETAPIGTADCGSTTAGYFTFGEAICFGRSVLDTPAGHVNGHVPDLAGRVAALPDGLRLPFDLTEVVDNLRYERYARPAPTPLGWLSSSRAAHATYYFVRPALPIAVRKQLQKVRLSGWRDIAFPRWPVEASVDVLMRETLRTVLRQRPGQAIPFIWFWPNGADGCVMMTHDVEGVSGAHFVPNLMDLDAAAGIPSSFQVVPEAPYTPRLVALCRQRGFEVNVHDLNHDGHLFRDKATFDARIAEINRHAREFDSRGFRSGAMYRRQEWFSDFEFDFDMSVPAVAHFEPQQGGCCTVMPYFIGDVLELPLTTTQDYQLFNFVGEYSIALWEAQTEAILSHHGLVSFIAHPDYLREPLAGGVYRQLLDYLTRIKTERNLWMAKPSEIDTWWRERRAMHLVQCEGEWRIEGPGSARACVAQARLDEGSLVYDRSHH
ncbi:MAG: hypothetical protein AB7I50_08275 [Vicinamibacterales bacterium]